MGAAGWMAFGQTEIRLIATIRVDHATKDGAQIPSPVGATIFAHPFRMRAKASPKRVSLPPLRGEGEPRCLSCLLPTSMGESASPHGRGGAWWLAQTGERTS